MEKAKRDYYINFSFGLILFIFSSYFLEDQVFHTSSALDSGVIALACSLPSFGLAYWLRDKKLSIKAGVLGGIILVLIITAKIINSHAVKQPGTVEKLFKGNWISKEDSFTVNLFVNDTAARLTFMPLKREIDYTYKVVGKEIDFYDRETLSDLEPGENPEAEMKWNIVKINQDTLSVTWEQESALFIRVK